jgi:hypothetical protein
VALLRGVAVGCARLGSGRQDPGLVPAVAGRGGGSGCAVWGAVGGDGCFARCVTRAPRAAPTSPAKPEKTQNSVTEAIKYQWMWV